jgi:hypothetical protein
VTQKKLVTRQAIHSISASDKKNSSQELIHPQLSFFGVTPQMLFWSQAHTHIRMMHQDTQKNELQNLLTISPHDPKYINPPTPLSLNKPPPHLISSIKQPYRQSTQPTNSFQDAIHSPHLPLPQRHGPCRPLSQQHRPRRRLRPSRSMLPKKPSSSPNPTL